MFQEDKTAFLRDFGEVATLTYDTDKTRSVTVIFNFSTDVEYLAPSRDAPDAFNDTPVITGVSSEFSDVVRGAPLTIRGKSYKLKEDPKDDSTGFFDCELIEV